METGSVKWFNDAKGFGFIPPDGGGEDLFAHFSEIRVEGFKTLQENQKVSFDVKTGPKGKQAANIKPISESPVFYRTKKAPRWRGFFFARRCRAGVKRRVASIQRTHQRRFFIT